MDAQIERVFAYPRGLVLVGERAPAAYVAQGQYARQRANVFNGVLVGSASSAMLLEIVVAVLSSWCV